MNLQTGGYRADGHRFIAVDQHPLGSASARQFFSAQRQIPGHVDNRPGRLKFLVAVSPLKNPSKRVLKSLKIITDQP